jgi:phosphoribosylformimino-5-aminoimidazole carboxamide ribonucleotide (ProFAR) isomerase
MTVPLIASGGLSNMVDIEAAQVRADELNG